MKTKLYPHDRSWASKFAELRAVYINSLGDLALRVEHVGSTAVPDLLAKPIIDIDIVIQSYSVFPEIVSALELLGYQHRGDQGIVQREVFKSKRIAATFARTQTFMPHHLYVCPASSPELLRHISFRDVLRARPDLRREYEAIKLSIAHRAGGDGRLYAEIKAQECGEFVERVLGQAEQPLHATALGNAARERQR